MADANGDSGNYQYDVCLSFAGEDRDYAEQVADELRKLGVRVFYDRYEKAELWGKDLYEHLAWVYSDAARYCVLFVSEHYARKVWTSHERKNAQSRALGEHGEYVLPARFDDTQIPGLPGTVGHVDLHDTTPAELAELIHEKLGPRQQSEFFPPQADRLYEALDATEEDAQVEVYRAGDKFFRCMQRMSPDERLVVTTILGKGCAEELPTNVHMSLNLVARETGFPEGKVQELVGAIHALGFTCLAREPEEMHHDEIRADDKMLVLSWSALLEGIDHDVAMRVAFEAIRGVHMDHCEQHGNEALARLDFSALATATAEEDVH